MHGQCLGIMRGQHLLDLLHQGLDLAPLFGLQPGNDLFGHIFIHRLQNVGGIIGIQRLNHRFDLTGNQGGQQAFLHALGQIQQQLATLIIGNQAQQGQALRLVFAGEQQARQLIATHCSQMHGQCLGIMRGQHQGLSRR